MTKGRNQRAAFFHGSFFVALDGNGLAAGLVVVVGGQEVHPARIYRLGLWPSGCGAVEETSIRFDSFISVSTRRGRGPIPKTK